MVKEGSEGGLGGEGRSSRALKLIPPDEPSSAPSGSIQLHTLTLELNLLPPVTRFRYYGRPPEDNPAYIAYDSLRTLLTRDREAMVPLTILPSLPGLLDTTTTPARSAWSKSAQSGSSSLLCVGLFPHGRTPRKAPALLRFSPKPTSVSADVSCGLLPIGGASEWLEQSVAWDMLNWLHAALAVTGCTGERKGTYLDDVERFSLRSALQLCWQATEKTMHDNTGASQGDAVIKAIITVDLYVNPTTLCTPTSYDIQAELIGLIMHSVTPADSSSARDGDSDNRVSALKDFFACMQPAPKIYDQAALDALQPRGMTATLLPFQKRTLRLLLQREAAPGYPMAAHPTAACDPAGFWKRLVLEQEDGTLAYRRLTGTILGAAARPSAVMDRKGKRRAASPELEIGGFLGKELADLPQLLDLSGVRGTMLCEEMGELWPSFFAIALNKLTITGLGKTVEAIALMLKHRHPLSVARHMEVDLKPDVANLGATTRGAKSGRKAAKSQKEEEVVVPVIDLSGDPPGLDDEKVYSWLQAEQEAFKATKVYDELSQVHVVEAGVSCMISLIVPLRGAEASCS